jgi:hypothetical protein
MTQNMTLKEKVIEVGKKHALDLYNNCDGSYVGEMKKYEFTFEGTEYFIEINAHWETEHFFDYEVSSSDPGFQIKDNNIKF